MCIRDRCVSDIDSINLYRPAVELSDAGCLEVITHGIFIYGDAKNNIYVHIYLRIWVGARNYAVHTLSIDYGEEECSELWKFLQYLCSFVTRASSCSPY